MEMIIKALYKWPSADCTYSLYTLSSAQAAAGGSSSKYRHTERKSDGHIELENVHAKFYLFIKLKCNTVQKPLSLCQHVQKKSVHARVDHF